MADSCEPNFTSVRAFILPNITSIPPRNTVEVYTLTFLSKKSCIKIVQGATQDKKTETNITEFRNARPPAMMTRA